MKKRKQQSKDHVREITSMLEDIEESQKSKHILYISRILGRRVVDENGLFLGRVRDIAIDPAGSFPKAIAIVVKKRIGRRRKLSWDGFDLSQFPRHLIVHDPEILHTLSKNAVFVGEKILDQQLVDTNGIKIIRANDVAFISIHNTLFLVSINIGFKGLLRRIGLNPDHWKIKDHLVPWKYIESIEGSLRDIRLTISGTRLHTLHPADFADLLEELAREERLSLFRNLKNEYAARILDEADTDVRLSLISQLSSKRLIRIFNHMYEHNVADILLVLSDSRRNELLKLMNPQDAAHFKLLMKCDKDTAGHYMTRRFVTVPQSSSIRDVIRMLQAKEQPRVLHAVYTVKGDGILTGVLSLRSLLVSRAKGPVSHIMKKKAIYARASTHKNEVYSIMAKYDLPAVPLVDSKHRIIGIINVEDLLKERVYVPAKTSHHDS